MYGVAAGSRLDGHKHAGHVWSGRVPAVHSNKTSILMLVSTGYVMNEDTRKVLKMGAQNMLQKPHTLEDINTKIMDILNKTTVTR